jgi:hypothetical protein
VKGNDCMHPGSIPLLLRWIFLCKMQP